MLIIKILIACWLLLAAIKWCLICLQLDLFVTTFCEVHKIETIRGKRIRISVLVLIIIVLMVPIFLIHEGTTYFRLLSKEEIKEIFEDRKRKGAK